MIGRSIATLALALGSLSACSGDPTTPASPAHADVTQLDLPANDIHRPLTFSQAWDSAGNDFSNPCIVPGLPGPVVLPGATSGQGIGTHMGAHTIEIVTTACPWVPDSAKVLASGTWTIQTANGDKLSGTYYSYWDLGTLSSRGKIFITAGTGRFEGATGEAVLETQDNVNLSGSDKGEGWIAY